METFMSVMESLGLQPAEMMSLMRECGMKPNINAQFTADEVNALYAAFMKRPQPDKAPEKPIVEPVEPVVSGADSEPQNEADSESSIDIFDTESEEESVEIFDTDLDEEISGAENFGSVVDEEYSSESGADFEPENVLDESEQLFNETVGADEAETTGEDSGVPESSQEGNMTVKAFAESVNASDKEIEKINDTIRDYGIYLVNGDMLTPEDQKTIKERLESLRKISEYLKGKDDTYGKGPEKKDPDEKGPEGVDGPTIDGGTTTKPEKPIKGSDWGIDKPEKPPVRPLVDKFSIPRDEILNVEYDLNAGRLVYRKDGRGSQQRTPYRLIEAVQSGKGGGEGIVYNVKNEATDAQPSRENLVAKIFLLNSCTRRREAKINTMLRIGRGLHCNGICLPNSILVDEEGVFTGYLMMKAKGEKLSSVIDKLVKREKGQFFSNWTRKEILTLIISILEKFKFLHDRNILVGDVCLDNIMVSSPKDVYIVDTDSFQIIPNNKLDDLTDQKFLQECGYRIAGYPCQGEREDYNSPEFQDALREYEPSEIFRTKDDELFSLAVLLFEIMFMGQWPYTRRGMPDRQKAKKEKRFYYPKIPLTRSRIEENREQNFGGIPKYGLVNLPEGYIQMWDHIYPSLKEAFIEAFSGRGSHSSEGTRYTADEWLALFTDFSKKFKWWTDIDPASAELFPERFRRERFKRQPKRENGKTVKDERGRTVYEFERNADGSRIPIHYVECRFCHDDVDQDTCRGKYHDECPVCWENKQAFVQECRHCVEDKRKDDKKRKDAEAKGEVYDAAPIETKFLITASEAKKSRARGKPFRDLCDDHMHVKGCKCRVCGSELRITRRIENELFWEHRDTWIELSREERDYSEYCPNCTKAVKCEKCGCLFEISRQIEYDLKKSGKEYSSVCPHCRIVSVKCEICGETFKVEQHVVDELKEDKQPVSSICPKNVPVQVKCDRCGKEFEILDHVRRKMEEEGSPLHSVCPEAQMVSVTCKKCGPLIPHKIEAYWLHELERNGEDYDCGNHKKFGMFGSSGSKEPEINHR